MVDKLIEYFKRLRRTTFYQKYGLYIIALIIGLLIFSMINDVDDYLINLGEPPEMGVKGIVLFLFLIYLGIELEFKYVTGLFLIVLPVSLFWGWSELYVSYAQGRYKEIMKEKNLVTGIVCGKNIDIGRGYRHRKIKIKYEYNYTYKFIVSTTSDNFQEISVGDPVLILTSREYPQVMEVLKWNPTSEEIERYKTPRKFKSYINGKIYEEEE